MIATQARRVAKQRLERVNQSQALEASAVESDSLASAVTDLAREIEISGRPTFGMTDEIVDQPMERRRWMISPGYCATT